MKKNWFFTTFSLIVIVSLCTGAMIVTGIGGWLWLRVPSPSNAPLTRVQVEFAAATSTAIPTALPLTPTPSPTATPRPLIPTPLSAPTTSPTPPPASPTVTATPAPTATPDEITQARGFALPPGSVNALTQEGVATQLVIPKLNLDAPVVLAPIKNGTWDVEFLGQTLVGHLEGTAPPGSTSNIVLAAHVTTDFNVYGPFAGLSLLAPGDDIYVYNQEQKYHYQVLDYQLVDRSNVEVTYPSNKSEITLITCNRWSKEEQRYVERLVVKGRLVTP